MNAYYACRSRQKLYSWEHDAVEEIIKLANILSTEERSFFSDRAYCPLCGEGSSSPYERGFSVPEGLRRHLTGRGNIQKCSVTQVAMSLAHDYWQREYADAEKAEEAEKREKLAQRKKSEVLYRTAPDLEPELIDKRLSFGGTPRSKEEFYWVEERLTNLGFQITCDANAKSYTNEHGDFVVYADPRQKGKVDLSVFRKNHKCQRQSKNVNEAQPRDVVFHQPIAFQPTPSLLHWTRSLGFHFSSKPNGYCALTRPLGKLFPCRRYSSMAKSCLSLSVCRSWLQHHIGRFGVAPRSALA